MSRASAATRWYGALPLGAKLRAFPALAGVALALVLLVQVGFGMAGEARLLRLGSRFYPTVEASWRLDQTLTATQRGFQTAAATGDADDLARADSLAGAFLAVLRAPGVAAAGHDHAALERLFARYADAARQVTARVVAGEMGEDATGAMRALAARQRALRLALDADAERHRGSLRAAFLAEQTWLRGAWLLGLFVTLATVLGLARLSRLATRLITAPLREAVTAADRVAAGDLSVRLPDAGPDEVGDLLRTMSRMVESLGASEERLRHQATHDPLTGLANRALFRERLAHADASAERATVAVLYADLDDFKTVNDSLGHEAGDRLLGLVADRLLTATRGCDTVARLGGDEFAVLLRGVRDRREASVVADRVTRALAAPFRLGGTEVRCGASIGIALGTDAEASPDLLRFADLAMYSAKHAGKHRAALFAPTMYTAALQRAALEQDLGAALERGELHVHYQPVVRLDTGRVVGAEALLRWRHPERGNVSPAEFIPIAEATGLIVPIGRWVLETACAQAAAWRGAGAPGFRVAVNLSAVQVQQDGLGDVVRDALARAALPASALTLEITETVMLTDTEATLGRLHELKALGVRLAIDDFGTGYSSLAYLHRFPVDVLKIDRAFVDGLGRAGHDATLTRAIVAIGDALGLPMVAEGVERAEQVDALRALGCTLAQGFHFARPMEAAALSARLAEDAAEGAVALAR
jgi:diguanylate cyclase (GGDEF)-like protein